MGINRSTVAACMIAGAIGITGCGKKEESAPAPVPAVPTIVKNAKTHINEIISTKNFVVKPSPSLNKTQEVCAKKINEYAGSKYSYGFGIPMVRMYDYYSSNKKLYETLKEDTLYSLNATSENSSDYCFFLAQYFLAESETNKQNWFKAADHWYKSGETLENFIIGTCIALVAILGLYIADGSAKGKVWKAFCSKWNISFEGMSEVKQKKLIAGIETLLNNLKKGEQFQAVANQLKAELQKVNKQTEVFQDQISKKNQELSKKDNVIAQKERIIADRDATIVQQKEIIKDRDASISQQQGIITERDIVIENLKNNVLIKSKIGAKISSILRCGDELSYIIEEMKRMHEGIEDGDDIGHFTVYSLEEVEDYVTEMKKTIMYIIAKFSNTGNDVYLMKITALSEKASTAFDSGKYSQAIEYCFRCLGVCTFLDELYDQQASANTSGGSGGPDFETKNEWKDFLNSDDGRVIGQKMWLKDDQVTLHDFFDLLGISVETVWSSRLVREVEKQCKRKAKDFHPDKNIGAPDQAEKAEKFKLLKVAKDMFSNKNTFEIYIRAYTIFSSI